MELFFFWFVFSVVIGVGAGARGRSGFGWFVLAMLISPLLAVILLVLLPSLKQPAASDATPVARPADPDAPQAWKTRVCPFCAETIKVEAIKCKHCGSMVGPAGPPHSQPRSSPDAYRTDPHFGKVAGSDK